MEKRPPLWFIGDALGWLNLTFGDQKLLGIAITLGLVWSAINLWVFLAIPLSYLIGMPLVLRDW